MRNYVLASLFLLTTFNAHSQNDISKSIAKNALRKMAGGKQLTTYELSFTYELPREVPKEIKQQSPMEDLMKSIMSTMSDSMRTAMKTHIDSAIKQSYEDRVSMFAGWRETFVSDLANRKAVRIRTNPNSLSGSTDTSRTVYQGNLKDIFAVACRNVPIALLQYMASDSSELHYTGTSTMGGDESDIVQVRDGSKWIDVYIGRSSLLVNRIVESQVDTDPLIGRGPEYYKHITVFSGYYNLDGLMFPAMQEEISSRDDFTVRKRLEWAYINKTVPRDIFKPEPAYEEKFRFKVITASDSLFVVVRSGNGADSRSLIRLTADNRMDCFMLSINHKEVASRMASAIEKEFPGKRIRDIYAVDQVSTISAFDPFYALNASVTAPRGRGMMSEDQFLRYNKMEDSTWKARTEANVLVTFDKDFQKNAVAGYVLNPDIKAEWEQFRVCYYLPKEKLIYCQGNPYMAYRGDDNATIVEKWLYDLISAKKVEVEKIIFAEAYVSGSPLEMPFSELENRVKKTDYSKYYNRK